MVNPHGLRDIYINKIFRVAVAHRPARQRHSREEADGRAGGAIGVGLELRLWAGRLKNRGRESFSAPK